MPRPSWWYPLGVPGPSENSYSSKSSSSSSYSSSSTSSSSLSSDNSSSEDLDGHPLGKAQHSQSCTDISRKHKYFEDRDDTTPLIDKRGSSYKLPSKQKREKGKSSKTGPTHGTLKNTHRITRTNDGSFRKAKSMEALSSARERDGFEHEDEQEQEKRKNDAKKNLMKEKMKFSAFLNEITRQVLSPMRLTTLGVTDAQRPSSAGQARVGSGTAERHRQQTSRPASADSVTSSRHSQSSQLSNSKSIQRHHSRRRSSGSSDHIYSRPKSCTDISCLKRRNSWSQNPRSHSPSYAHHHHDQEDHHSHDHHYDHDDCSSPSSHHHHSDHHNRSHHHHHHRHHQNPVHHHDHNSPSYRHHDHSDASHHHHYGDHHGDRHSPARHHREHLSSAHHHHHHHGDHHDHANHDQHSEPHGDVPHHGDAHITSHNHHHHHHHREHHSPTHHHQEHHHSGDGISGHHNSNHPNTEHPTTPHHHDHHSPRHHHHHRDHHGLAVHKSGHQHHHGDHHSETHHHHHREHNSPSHHHHHEDHHSRSHPHHHKDHPSEPHHQDLEDHHSPGHYRHHVDHHGEAHQHHHVDHHSESHHHHHGDHRNEGHSHHHGDHHNEGHHHHHGEHRSESHQHHHVDHHSEGHHHQHGDHQNDSHSHHHGDHHIDSHQHHHTDHHSEGHHHHHGDHHKEPHEHHHGDHHSEVHQHHHGDHHSESHQHHHGDHRNEAHHHHHGDNNREAQHHHGEHSSPIHSHHHGDHHNESHQHHRGHHHSPDHQHHHGNHHNETHRHSAAVQQHHNDHQHSGHLHHQGEHHHESHHHHHHHGEHHNPSQKHIHNDTGHHPESYFNQPHFKTNDVDHDDHHAHLKRHSDVSPPSRRNISSVSSQEEEQTNFTGSSLHKEKALELGRIMVLQEQNEGMHKSLLKTAVRMECLGEEFMSSQKLLEAELQRTRVELSNLTEKFKRLHDNYSSTQQTNNLLEQKLHSVAQGMEGERERLNQRISSLTKQLADAKFADSVESFNVTSVLHKTDRHFHSDNAINQVILPITPPPAQFMDSHNYGKAKAAGQEQCLGSVPEEEESDWSEMGEETPRFILTGSNRGQAWRHREADVDKDSESGGEEMIRCHSPRPLQIPHLQFTIHNEILSVPQTGNCPSGFKNLSDGITGEGTYRITTSPNHSSAILIRSASLEEIPLARHEMQKELRGTEAMMDLHHQGDDAMEDLDNEIIHHWRTSSNVDGEGRTPEANSGLAGLQSAERMLNHFMCEATAGEGKCQGRAEQHGWTGGIPEEVLRGERTQL